MRGCPVGCPWEQGASARWPSGGNLHALSVVQVSQLASHHLFPASVDFSGFYSRKVQRGWVHTASWTLCLPRTIFTLSSFSPAGWGRIVAEQSLWKWVSWNPERPPSLGPVRLSRFTLFPRKANQNLVASGSSNLAATLSLSLAWHPVRFRVSEVGLCGGRRETSRELVNILCGAGRLCPHWRGPQAPPCLFTEPRAVSSCLFLSSLEDPTTQNLQLMIFLELSDEALLCGLFSFVFLKDKQ